MGRDQNSQEPDGRKAPRPQGEGERRFGWGADDVEWIVPPEPAEDDDCEDGRPENDKPSR